jgi:hypothetical protein
MQGSPTFNGCVPACVAVLTGLRRLKLGISGLPGDTLSHLAPLAGLTSLQVDFSDPRDHEYVWEGGVVLPSALAHLGALSGLTRLAMLYVVDLTPSERLKCMQPAAALLAALPSSPFLSEVRPGGRCRGLLAHLTLGTPHTRGAHSTAHQLRAADPWIVN